MRDVAAGTPTMSFHGFRSPFEACSEHLAPRAVERPEPDPKTWPRGVPDLVRRSRLAKSRRPWGATSGNPTSRPPQPRSEERDRRRQALFLRLSKVKVGDGATVLGTTEVVAGRGGRFTSLHGGL